MATCLKMINKLIIYKFLTDFTNKKKTNSAVVFRHRTLPSILKSKTIVRLSNNLEYKIPLDTYWKVWTFRFIVLHDQSAPESFEESMVVITYLINFGVTLTIWSFRLFLKQKTGKKRFKSWRLHTVLRKDLTL